MQFRVLGPVEAHDGQTSINLGTPRQRRLLGLLLLRASEVVSYDRLAEDLWDAEPPATARHTLQGYVHRLRRALADEAGRLETQPLGYRLKVSAGELDAAAFEDLVETGRRALVRSDPRAATSALEAALDLWRDTPFADLGDLPAFEAERARLDALRMTALEDRIDAELALGHHDALVPEIEGLLAQHPFRERLWGQLMVARYRAGRQAGALEAFRNARQVLDDELGIQPGRWLCRLQEQILLQDPSLDAPERARLPAVDHNLPAPRDTFVGRQRELADLEGLLRTRRLVTVTGPPGAGKTRVALEAARRVLGDWPHGVYVVPLAEVQDAGLVPSAIATAIRTPAEAERPVLETLIDHLHSRRVLLLLDNVEHLPDAVPPVASSLLDAAPQLTVLATSRSPLRLAGEQTYALGPLPLPPQDDEAVEDAGDAVALFVERAVAVDPNFRLTPDSVSVVVDVVARLDGLPLAIELAAARLRSFNLDGLRRHLEPALPRLVTGTVEPPRHHRTLRDAVAWSNDLLAHEDRLVLRRLAVFVGGFTAETARPVVGAEDVDDVVGSLARLVEASLLDRPEGDPPRYRMLETVREYAEEQLRADGEEPEVRERHAAVHAALAGDAAPHLTQADQAHWVERLDAEHPNLRAALRWALDAGDADAALELSADLWRYWQLRGRLEEGRDWLTRALALDGRSPIPHIRALLGLAGICYWQFDLDTAEATYQQARDRARSLDEWWLQLEALLGLVVTIACHRGDLDEAVALEREFQDLVSERDDVMAMGMGMATSQMVRLLTGDLEESRAYGERCLAGTRAVGERWYELQVLRTLALTALRQERYELARDELRGCVEIAMELGELPGLAMDLDRLGQVAVLFGDPEGGCVLAGAADRLRERVGTTITPEAFRWQQDPADVLAQDALEESVIERARARGRSLTLEEATALARTGTR